MTCETPTSTPASAPLTRRALREQRALQSANLAHPDADAAPGVDATSGGIADSVITDTFATIAGVAAVAADAAAADLADSDAFETAARTFAARPSTGHTFRGDAPHADEPKTERTAPAAAAPGHVPPRRNGLAAFKRVAAASFSLGVVGVVGLMTVGMTTPVAAVAASSTTTVPVVSEEAPRSLVASDEIQVYVAPAAGQAAPITRTESYATASLRQYAADFSIAQTSDLFVNDTSAAIQWPFPVGVPMSSPFGMRDGRMHEGVDFVPGEGSKIQAIADGTVRIATENGDAFGVTVLLDHTIDGQLVSTRYGHMQYGSLQVKPGDQVKVGQVLGSVGNTGRSFGAHLHFEVHVGGDTPVDPITWLQANAGRKSLG